MGPSWPIMDPLDLTNHLVIVLKLLPQLTTPLWIVFLDDFSVFWGVRLISVLGDVDFFGKSSCVTPSTARDTPAG